MLRDFVENNHALFVESCEDWQDAMRKCCSPLIADGTITAEYPEDIIENVGKYGPYFVLQPGIAMPHAQEGGAKVFKTTISFMKSEKPVVFDENDEDSWADLFFTLASCNHDEHLEHMQQLMDVLMNEELVEELHSAKSSEDLIKLADKYGL